LPLTNSINLIKIILKMKKIRIVLALFIGVLAISLQAQKNDVADAKMDAPVITFTKPIHDFGKIYEGDIVETTFEFKNTGNAPLLITKIKASCGCTLPSKWKKEAILPGEVSSFVVKFNSKNKPNKQNKKIRISSNTLRNNEFVTIKAQVTPNPEFQKNRDERMKKWKEKRDMKMKKSRDIKKEKPTKEQMVRKSSLQPTIKDSEVKK